MFHEMECVEFDSEVVLEILHDEFDSEVVLEILHDE